MFLLLFPLLLLLLQNLALLPPTRAAIAAAAAAVMAAAVGAAQSPLPPRTSLPLLLLRLCRLHHLRPALKPLDILLLVMLVVMSMRPLRTGYETATRMTRTKKMK
jgi:hypothetical protein